MPFDSLQANRFPRRAFLAMPLAFAGLTILCYPRRQKLPDVSRDGIGPTVELTFFSETGKWEAVVGVHKLVQSDGDWRKKLTSEEYAITRRKGTEFAFANRYWNSHEPGMYRCVCCGNALFRSDEKFDSGTGWPSFSAAVAKTNIYTEADLSLSLERVEVLCRKCDAHLGHVFEDGPPPTGLRYCVNSAALRLVPYS